MADSLPTHLAEHLRRLGEEIDIGRQPTVFDGGLVGLSDATEGEVRRDVAGQEAGPQAGTRSGRRARARRAQAPDHAFGSDALEAAHGAGFRILAQHYEALAFEDTNGLWVAVSSLPLGRRGPEVHFLIAVPIDVRFTPRAWAFGAIGSRVRPMSLKHTNFPDASICAFPHGYWPWPNADGLVGLVDIYVLWAVRKLHRDVLGWWPGPQMGAGAHYRQREFDPREDCGCGSKKSYGQCHMGFDLLENPERSSLEFRRQFLCDFDDRRVPECILNAARSRWKQLPNMADIFSRRQDPSGLTMI